MKTITFLVASVVMTSTISNASESSARYRFDEPISFIERGVEYFVFPNGEFDFNTHPGDSQGSYYFKTAGRRGTAVATGRPLNYGILIAHDSFGRVRRIGNTFINYDARDRVNRIGSVFMRYNRFALTQIGGMQLVYNRRGDIIDTIGSVNGFGNQGYVYPATAYAGYDHGALYPNDNHYYYRADGTKARIEDAQNKK